MAVELTPEREAALRALVATRGTHYGVIFNDEAKLAIESLLGALDELRGALAQRVAVGPMTMQLSLMVPTVVRVAATIEVVSRERNGLIVRREEAVRVLRASARNYELERELNAAAGHKLDEHQGPKDPTFVIGDWCPFNGIYCAWADYAPLAVMTERMKTCSPAQLVYLRERIKATGRSLNA